MNKTDIMIMLVPFVIIAIAWLMFQYVVVLAMLDDHDLEISFKTKRDFLISLIPFAPTIIYIVNWIKKMRKMYNDLDD